MQELQLQLDEEVSIRKKSALLLEATKGKAAKDVEKAVERADKAEKELSSLKQD